MNTTTANKHATRSAQTRERFIASAQQLFAERSIDSVSLNEITVAAGQKNRNALQYHFDNRDGLLQAIIDKHADRVFVLRKKYLDGPAEADKHAARAAAQALVMPLAEYIAENPEGIYYVKILSQLAALNSNILNPSTRSGLTFQNDEQFSSLLRRAVSHLPRSEAQRRMFLAVSITFHGIADVCRAGEADDASPTLKKHGPMFEQVALAIETLLAAAPIQAG